MPDPTSQQVLEALDLLVLEAEQRAQAWRDEHLTPEAARLVELAQERQAVEFHSASLEVVAAVVEGISPEEAIEVWKRRCDAAIWRLGELLAEVTEPEPKLRRLIRRVRAFLAGDGGR